VKELLTLAGIIISATVALIIADLHRKQMRQIEVFRHDPTQGLHPPPSRFLTLLKTYGPYAFGVGFGVFLLVGDLADTGPITRLTILQIVFHASFIGLLLILGIFTWGVDQTAGQISQIAGQISKRLSDITAADQTKEL
jgi:hypothetical protein